jgi:hypothetical protein
MHGEMAAPRWSLWERVAFRFGILAGALCVFPFPFGYIPKTAAIAHVLRAPLEWLTAQLAAYGLGMPDVTNLHNSSGDTTWDYVTLLLVAIVATLGTIAWSIVDRRRPAYPVLAARALVVLRYVVAYAMVSYGFAKITRAQFPAPNAVRLDEPVGDMSPMGLLWTFMGGSGPYTVFAGFAETFGGLLLLWRRTAFLGAVVAIAVMTNVVLLNFCYDVPIKLYSCQLLAMAIAIALPDSRRVLAAALGRATTAAPPRPRRSPRSERTRWIAKLLMCGAIGWSVYNSIARAIGPDPDAQMSGFLGTWVVDSCTIAGDQSPPLAARWARLMINPRSVQIVTRTGDRDWPTVKHDAAAHTLQITLDEHVRDPLPKPTAPAGDTKLITEQWTYARPAFDRLVIDGTHRGTPFHVAMHLLPPPPLVTRGFRWINDAAYNW